MFNYFLTLKNLRKVLFYVLLVVVTVVVALTASVFLFKDKIINQFIRQANTQLNTPVKIGKIDVSVFKAFPNLSIILKDVYVEDSHEGQYPLLTAAEISFQLNPIEVWQEKYIVTGLQITDSETTLKIDARGINNYTVAKEGASSGAVSFQLDNVRLINTRVRYADASTHQDLVFTSERLRASIKTINNVYTIKTIGELTTEKIEINRQAYFTEKSFQLSSELIYDDAQKILTIKPSNIMLKKAGFTLSGQYVWKDKSKIDLLTSGNDADIQSLLSLLPGDISNKVEKYQSKGNVYFKATLKGEISDSASPTLSVDFGFNKTTIFHPEFKTRIEDASLRGSFATSNVTDMAQAVLVLKDINGTLNKEPFAANFVLQNFKNPDVLFDFKGRVDAAALADFYPVATIKNVSGALLADIAFKGKIELLKNKATAQRVSTQGTIDLEEVSCLYGEERIPLQKLNGNLQFSNNDLALSNVSGKLGNSDFLFNGFFKNVITFLLFENQPIGIETDLKSSFLDVDQLFSIAFGKPASGNQAEYEFSISRNINLNFNCDIKHLRYKRFHAQQLKGDLLVKNEMAVSRGITLKSMGGTMNLSGIVDTKNKKAIDVVSSVKLQGIHVDSIFYVFENFGQNFIEDKHLKGLAYADISLEMVLSPNLTLFSNTLIGDISVTIKNGELNNFEPMKSLNKFLDDEGLSKLRFADLKNDIHIENKTIYIPQMEVRTNVTALKVSGTHTFDQQIDYRIVTPLRRKKNDPEFLNAIEEDGSGQSKLYLKITGTTDNYRVAYDTEAVKKKIANDLKKEVQELKDAFRNKGAKRKKELELQQDEYFDWEDQ